MYKGIIGFVAGASLLCANAVSAGESLRTQEQHLFLASADSISQKAQQRSYSSMASRAQNKNSRYSANEKPKKMPFYGKDYPKANKASMNKPAQPKAKMQKRNKQKVAAANEKPMQIAYNQANAKAPKAAANKSHMQLAKNNNGYSTKKHHRNAKHSAKRRHSDRGEVRRCPAEVPANNCAYEKARMQNFIDNVAPEHR